MLWSDLGHIGEFALALFALTGIVYAALSKGRSDALKSHVKESASLADTRGDRIADLEEHIIRLEGRIAALEARLTATEALKAQEIADRVVAALHYFPTDEHGQRK